MKLDALLCSCNNMEMKAKAGKRGGGGYYRRKSVISRRSRGVVPQGGWFGAVRKKLLLVKTHNKNIIIIHNNTSIASNEEENRASSCIEPPKDQIATTKEEYPPALKVKPKNKSQNQNPGDDAVAVVKNEEVDHKETKREVQHSFSNCDQDEKQQNSDAVVVFVEEKLRMAEDVVDVSHGMVAPMGFVDEKKTVAAITIQTAFRSHLARRAFRALKSLVRLQAVARGVVVRRQARMALHCMRALLRLGDRVRTRQHQHQDQQQLHH